MSEQSEKRVGHVLVPMENYKTISHNCTIEDAVRLLHKSFALRGKGEYVHRFLIVYDDQGNPLGMVGFRSILQALEPFFVRNQNLSIPVFWEGLFSQRCRAVTGKNIKEIMSPFHFIALDANDTLIKAVHAMIKHKLETLPVLKDGCFVGMVRMNEIIDEVYGVMMDELDDLGCLDNVISV